MDTNTKLMVVFTKLSHTFLTNMGKNLEELGMPGSIYPILAHLNQVEKAKTQQLGEVAAITSGSITHIVNKLTNLGYVDKQQCKDDKRVFWVIITPKGRSEFIRVHTQHMKYLNHVLDVFTEDEKQMFIEQIKYFGKTIQKHSDKDSYIKSKP